MTTDPFNQLQKGRYPLKKILRHPEVLDLDEAATSISQAKSSPNYATLKLVLCSIETMLITQKEILRKLDEVEKK